MIFLYILGFFIIFILLVFIMSYLGQIFSELSTKKFLSKRLNHLMEVHYNGPFDGIVRNLDMFCGYYDYIYRNVIEKNNYSKDIILDISFELKNKDENKQKLCYNYLKLDEKDKEKLDKFLEDNYYIAVDIIEKDID